MKKIIFTLIMTLVFITIKAQDKKETQEGTLTKPSIFNSLKKANLNELDPNKPIDLNPNKTPFYKEDFSPVTQIEMMTMLNSGNYVPDLYIDSNKDIKAIVLRKATAEEKAGTMALQQNKGSKNNLVGKPAIDFSVTDIEGKTYSLTTLKNKVVVLNFWFVECKPCVMEIPELNELVEKYKTKNVVFLGLATNDKTKIETFLQNKPFRYNIVPRSEAVANAYGITSFPTHVVINKEGNITYLESGYSPISIANLKAEIDKQLK